MPLHHQRQPHHIETARVKRVQHVRGALLETRHRDQDYAPDPEAAVWVLGEAEDADGQEYPQEEEVEGQDEYESLNGAWREADGTACDGVQTRGKEEVFCGSDGTFRLHSQVLRNLDWKRALELVLQDFTVH